MTGTPRILLIGTDATLTRALVNAFSGVIEFVTVTSLDASIEELKLWHYDAVAWDAEDFGRAGKGFPELARHIAPDVRIISTRSHLAPHLVTAQWLRPSTLRNWTVRPSIGTALVDAMVASADDPVFGGPHIN